MKLTFTKKDFRIEFFRGSGPGGQHKNKRDTACRTTHIETGLSTSCQVHKSQHRNKQEAFEKMAKLLASHYAPEQRERYAASQETTRTYKETKDLVIDHVTGKKYSYKHTVGRGDISVIIEDRVNQGKEDEL